MWPEGMQGVATKKIIEILLSHAESSSGKPENDNCC
jgi:hypothetical protein